jgi:hypothetical protein
MGTKTTVQSSAPSAEERELTRIQTELSKLQLQNLNALQPFQQELLDLSLADLRRQGAISSAIDSAVTPEQQAALAKQDFERAQRLGPIQEELLNLQLEQIRSGGAATPEQLARIKEATDRGIEAGSADIDLSTQRGIGLIADELANSRGLRLSDSPIMREAAFLTRAGEDQKASLIKNLRAGEASAALNFPLAANQVMSGINLNQQQLADATKAFQADLRQRAFQNRLALTGQTAQTGIGLSSIANTSGAISGLASTRGKTQKSSGFGIGEIGQLASGIGALAAFSDRRLKSRVVRVGTHPTGIGIYEYDKFGRRERGVMADEVEIVRPEAVIDTPSGYKAVDYGKL